MTTPINTLRLLLVAALLILGFNSCCKKQVSTSLEVKFENFDFSAMDSVMVILTDRNDLDKAKDTTFRDLTEKHVFYIPVYDNDEQNGSIIIKNISPGLEHHVTEIDGGRKKSMGCAGGDIEFGFTWNGTRFKKEERHSITIEP